MHSSWFPAQRSFDLESSCISWIAGIWIAATSAAFYAQRMWQCDRTLLVRWRKGRLFEYLCWPFWMVDFHTWTPNVCLGVLEVGGLEVIKIVSGVCSHVEPLSWYHLGLWNSRGVLMYESYELCSPLCRWEVFQFITPNYDSEANAMAMLWLVHIWQVYEKTPKSWRSHQNHIIPVTYCTHTG